jgi:hypothetical protein
MRTKEYQIARGVMSTKSICFITLIDRFDSGCVVCRQRISQNFHYCTVFMCKE